MPFGGIGTIPDDKQFEDLKKRIIIFK